jgi:outer membrane lipoprotein-sorting protein
MRTVLLVIVGAIFDTLFVVQLVAQDSPSQPAFPDTEVLVSRVAEHQKAVEELFDQYTCTYKSTIYTLDKAGSVRSQHTDTYYMTPTPYEVFMLHISHDGKSSSQDDLQRQEKEIERKLRNYERKAEKNPNARPKNALLFADIILKSRFTPLRWDTVSGIPTVVYSFAPKSQPARHGSSEEKIAGDLNGTMWVDPEDGEIVRMEFISVSPLSLGFLVNVKGFQGFVEQRKVNGEVWLPSRQDFVAQGRELIKGFRIHQVTEFSDYLKATTDVFQQVHSPNAVTGECGKVQQ